MRSHLLHVSSRQFAPAQLGGQRQTQVPIGTATFAHLRRKVDGQAANNGVAGLHLRGVKVGHQSIDVKVLLRSPFDRTGVAGNKISGHAAMVLKAAHRVRCGKLVRINAQRA